MDDTRKEASSSGHRVGLLAMGLLCAGLVLAGAAGACAWSTRGQPFPSLFVDPFGVFSNVHFPAWGAAPGLRHPDRLVALEGTPLTAPAAYGDFPSQRMARRLAELERSGHTEVNLVFTREGGGTLTLRAPLGKLGIEELWTFFGLYALAGVFVLGSAAGVAAISQRRAGRSAYVFWAAATAVFLITFYDHHTTARLTPLFTLSTLGMVLGALWLAYAFPEPPRRYPRLSRSALAVAGGAIALAAGWVVLEPLFALDATFVRLAVDIVLAPSMVTLVLGVVLRLRGSPGRERGELLSAVWGLVLVPICGAAILLMTLATGVDLLHLVLPVLIVSFPLSIGYALVRSNILAADAILTRRMLLLPVVLCALLGGSLAWLVVWSMVARHGANTLLPVFSGGITSVALVVGGWHLLGRSLFPAAHQFRPTLESLSDQLALLRDAHAVRETVVAVVLQWLPTTSARVLDGKSLDPGALPHLPGDARERLAAGEQVWTQESPLLRHLLVPMRSLGELRGVLLVAPKHLGALYTADDLALLDTIASLAAVALHHAEVLLELEGFRQLEREAARDEKRLTLALLSAEISHEIAYPLNFFRYLLKQGARGTPLDGQDVEIGREEVERLERMLVSLRKLSVPPPRREPVRVVPRLRRALDLMRELIQEKQLELALELPEDLVLLAEPDPLVQLFANLLRNAAQAVGPKGTIGVRHFRDERGLVLEIWDDGPGVPESLAADIFNPWVTTREGGLGLGLAVTQRIVCGFGWNLSLQREGGRTCFQLRIPPGQEVAANPAEPNT